MPNHVTTVCVVTGLESDVARFVESHLRPVHEKPGTVFFDFQTVIPAPEIVAKTESGSDADNGFFALTGLHDVKFAAFSASPMHMAAEHQGFPMNALTTREQYAEWLAETRPEAIEKGRLALQCFRETGHRDWYSWNIENWGTKWNAYSYAERSREPGRFVFKFETAWSFPEPIFEKLAELFPALTFAVESIDEGGPEYAGCYSATEQRFAKLPESDERYIRVYGHAREHYDEDEPESGVLS